MIEIYLLEALASFYKYGTLSSAAEHLHISQPALSRSMKKLEDILDVSLFTRTKNSIALNDTGQLAAQYAESILKAQEQMIRSVRNYDSSLHTISAGYCTPSPMMELPPLLTRLYPQMMISSEMDDEMHLLKGLAEGKYQLVVLSHPAESENLISVLYGTESLYVSAPAAHPLAVYEKQGVSFLDINGSTFLQASEVGKWNDIVSAMMPDSRILKQDNLESLNELVNASSLLSFASDLTIRMFRRETNPGRIFIPINDPEATMHYYCIMNSNHTLDKLINYLQEKESYMVG